MPRFIRSNEIIPQRGDGVHTREHKVSFGELREKIKFLGGVIDKFAGQFPRMDNKSVNADAQRRFAAAPRLSMATGYGRR